MRNRAPALLPIFRSTHQAELLAWLLMHPKREYTLSDLGKQLQTSTSTLHKEVARLTEAGLINSRKVGNARLLQADESHPAAVPLTQLLELTFGALPVIADEFSQLAGAEQVIIYGSWAARRSDQPGPSPNDVDVLVVGKPTRSNVYAAADKAEQRLGLPVNTTIRSTPLWKSDSEDPLSAEIRQKPFVIAWELQGPDLGTGHHDEGTQGLPQTRATDTVTADVQDRS